MGIKISQTLPISFGQTRDFIYRPEFLEQWLGDGAQIQVKNNAMVRIPDPVGSLWRAKISQIESGTTKHEIHMVSIGTSQSLSEVIIRVTACSNSVSRVRVTYSGAATEQGHDEMPLFLRTLQKVMLNLKKIVGEEFRRRERVRQAVIIVHGMGQQLPGETLNQFATSVFPDGTNVKWQKPDYDSNSFEVRKITVNGTVQMPTTDVYEFYWAHLMHGNTLGKVVSWAFHLLRTPPKKVPRNLRWVVIPIQVLILLVAVVALIIWISPGTPAKDWLGSLTDNMSPEQQKTTVAGLSSAVLVVAGLLRFVWKRLGKNWAIDVLGDVPHYLQPKPENIERRQAIREAGVDLIERLHTSQKYDRIIMVGHSLGSVIAYDILTFAWIRIGRLHRSPSRSKANALTEIEHEIDRQNQFPSDTLSQSQLEQMQELQHRAWSEYRKNSMPWLVTDFVTLGSPLTHADLLWEDGSGSKFAALKVQRVLPACPPVTEELPRDAEPGRFAPISYHRSFTDITTGQRRTVTLPHQAGMFALTRWTNLYFPFRAPMWGDPVAGPVAPQFGNWVRDISLPHYSGNQRGVMGFAHTRYWQKQVHGSNSHIDALRKALQLDTRDSLQLIVHGLPYFETPQE